MRDVAELGGHVSRAARPSGSCGATTSVAAVEARLRDGTPLTVEAGAVVVAAGAIGSSVLLLRSGIRRNVGTRFSFNAATPVLGRYDEPRHSWAADQMTAFVDGGASSSRARSTRRCPSRSRCRAGRASTCAGWRLRPARPLRRADRHAAPTAA